MSGNQNIETIKDVYTAFGRGDVAAILAVVTDDVDCRIALLDAARVLSDDLARITFPPRGSAGSAGSDAPWWGVRKGKDQVGSFFDALGKTMEVEEFTPLAFAATDDGDVLTVVRYTARSRETGKAATMEIHHWFRFTNGKISRYRGTEDTIATAATLN